MDPQNFQKEDLPSNLAIQLARTKPQSKIRSYVISPSLRPPSLPLDRQSIFANIENHTVIKVFLSTQHSLNTTHVSKLFTAHVLVRDSD